MPSCQLKRLRFTKSVQWPDDPNLVPTPRELFRRLDAGLLSRKEFQEAMAVHARELIREIEEVKRSPLQAYLDEIANRASAMRLSLRHGEKVVRQALVGLSMVDDFPPARLLWNADHLHVPLHCFFRSRREPVFRVVRLEVGPQWLAVTVEHGAAEAALTVREELRFRRNRRGDLQLEQRQRVRLS